MNRSRDAGDDDFLRARRGAKSEAVADAAAHEGLGERRKPTDVIASEVDLIDADDAVSFWRVVLNDADGRTESDDFALGGCNDDEGLAERLKILDAGIDSRIGRRGFTLSAEEDVEFSVDPSGAFGSDVILSSRRERGARRGELGFRGVIFAREGFAHGVSIQVWARVDGYSLYRGR